MIKYLQALCGAYTEMAAAQALRAAAIQTTYGALAAVPATILLSFTLEACLLAVPTAPLFRFRCACYKKYWFWLKLVLLDKRWCEISLYHSCSCATSFLQALCGAATFVAAVQAQR